MRFSFAIRQILLCAVVAACGDSGVRGSRSLVEVIDSAGVRLIRNLDRSVDTTTVQLTEQLRIGVNDGPQELQFHMISGIATDQDGRLFVIDQGSLSVRIYDANGAFVRRFGGPGKGPGEFQQIGALFLWRDTVFVADLLASTRFTMFDTTGVVLAVRSAMLPDGRRVVPFAGGNNGWFLIEDPPYGKQLRYNVGDVSRYTATLKQANPRAFFQPGLTAEQADSALRPVTTYSSGRTIWRLGSEGGSERFVLGSSPMFEPSASMMIDGRGLVHIAHGWPYIIDVYDDTGRHLKRISRSHDSIPANDALAEEVVRRAREYFDTTSDRRGASYETYVARAGMPRIGFVPVTSTLRVSRDGWLWVRRPDLVADHVTIEWSRNVPPGPSFWDVFNPDGHFQHTVQLPPRFTLRTVTQNTAIGVLRDELDVEYVVRFGVTPRARS